MRTQRGFIMMYGFLACGAVILVLGIALKWQTSRLDAAQQEVAKVEAERDLWADSAQNCSKSVEDAKKESEKRTRIAKAALEQARIGQDTTRAELERLRASKGQTCQQAVETVRKGLK